MDFCAAMWGILARSLAHTFHVHSAYVPQTPKRYPRKDRALISDRLQCFYNVFLRTGTKTVFL